MKLIKYTFIALLMTLAMSSCVKDEVYEAPGDTPDVKESVICCFFYF